MTEIFTMTGHNGLVGGYEPSMFVHVETHIISVLFDNKREFSPITATGKLLGMAVKFFNQTSVWKWHYILFKF